MLCIYFSHAPRGVSLILENKFIVIAIVRASAAGGYKDPKYQWEVDT